MKHRNITYRLIPGSRERARKLAGAAGACRFVWNAALAANREAYEAFKIAPENRRSQSEFRCVSCGHTANADTNAAINILASGTRAAGRGEATALAASAIRQQIGEARSFL